jgi:hypothetical protein
MSPPKNAINNKNPESKSIIKPDNNFIREKHQPESRFQSDVYDHQNKISTETAVPDENLEYYRPDYSLEKQSMIQAKGNLNKTNDPKENEISYRNNIKSQEPVYFKPGKTSRDVYFSAVFDNDIFDYTDYYYTNGICLELFHPAIGSSPLSQLLPGLKYSLNYYGLTLTQNMYTPLKLDKPDIRYGDRPFASYLTLGHQRISLSPDRHRRLQSEITLGVLGPASLGCTAQDMIHTETPVGWVNQEKDDIVINYNIRFDQGIYSGNNIELAVIAGGQAGTLYDNIMAGFYLQLGKANDRYSSLFQTTERQKPFKKRIRYYFALDVKNKMIIYDATLEGGMFNRSSVYTLDGSQVRHYVFTGTATVGLGFGRYSLVAEQTFLTPEFDGGRHHLWFRIKNIIKIN